LFLTIVHASAAPSGSWPQWRGPNRDGTTADFSPPASWPAALTRLWRTPVGTGHASPVIADGRVFVHARSGEQEVVAAFDADLGPPGNRGVTDHRQGRRLGCGLEHRAAGGAAVVTGMRCGPEGRPGVLPRAGRCGQGVQPLTPAPARMPVLARRSRLVVT
jgi:hypothetical protein